MRSIFQSLSVLALLMALLAGCATQGGGSYAVGPGSATKSASSSAPSSVVKSSGLSVIVPVFYPGIPKDSDTYTKLGIWPELRRAEANRFSISLKEALEDTGSFEGVRVAATSVATGHIYVQGEIVKSNGEDLKVKIKVVDIGGSQLMLKEYKYRVKEYAIDDPRTVGKDLYEPLFPQIAKDVAKRVKRLSTRSVSNIQNIEIVRYGEAFSPDYFSKFIKTSSRGKVKLVSTPAAGDSMVSRINIIRVKDQMFLDGVQRDYLSFKEKMDADYISWQRQAFVEARAARKAAAKASAQKFLGALAMIGGAVAMANADYYDNSQIVGGASLIAAGAVAVGAGIETSRQAKMHRDSLNELGKSLNIELAPRVMQLEDQEVELEGTLEQQYTTWRSFLKEFYALEATPNLLL